MSRTNRPEISRRQSRFFLAVLFALLSAGVTGAEEDGSSFARVRYLEGELEITRIQDQESYFATVNTPVMAGDQLRTDPGGRAEIQLGDGSLLLADRATRFDILDLGGGDPAQGGVQGFRLREGTIFLDVRRGFDPGDTIRVDTPVASIFLEGDGEFRIDTMLSGEVVVSSYSGTAEVIGDFRSVVVNGGERTVVNEAGNPAPPAIFNTARMDDFFLWVEDRQLAYVRSTPGEDFQEPAYEDLPEEVIPYVPELNRYGGWSFQAVYGWVWRPFHLQVGWRPYSIGFWSYYPSEWTWVSQEPWGWYPYHYGRWQWMAGFGWGWVPGRVYSGAWVSWAYGNSYIGWCPLNYYNQPSFYGLHLSAYDSRSWVFVNYSRFQGRGLHSHLVSPREVLRKERVHRARRNPHFGPRDLRSEDIGRRLVGELKREPGRSRTPLSATVQRSFRDSDRSERKIAREPRNRSRREQPSTLNPTRTPARSGDTRADRPSRRRSAPGRSTNRPRAVSPEKKSASPRGPDRSRRESRVEPDRKVLREILDRNRRPPVVRKKPGGTTRPSGGSPRATHRSSGSKSGAGKSTGPRKGRTTGGKKASGRSSRSSRSKANNPRSSKRGSSKGGSKKH